jgi:hypothetical protein
LLKKYFGEGKESGDRRQELGEKFKVLTSEKSQKKNLD